MRKLNRKEFKSLVAGYYGIAYNELTRTSRLAHIVHARHVAIFLWREYTGRSWNAIAADFGYLDHTSAIHGYRKIKRMVQNAHESKLRYDIKVLTDEIKKGEVQCACA